MGETRSQRSHGEDVAHLVTSRSHGEGAWVRFLPRFYEVHPDDPEEDDGTRRTMSADIFKALIGQTATVGALPPSVPLSFPVLSIPDPLSLPAQCSLFSLSLPAQLSPCPSPSRSFSFHVSLHALSLSPPTPPTTHPSAALGFEELERGREPSIHLTYLLCTPLEPHAVSFQSTA